VGIDIELEEFRIGGRGKWSEKAPDRHKLGITILDSKKQGRNV
jgi:hypothetical protein